MSTKSERQTWDTSDPRQNYVVTHSIHLHPAQEKLIEATKSVRWSMMLSPIDQMQLLQNLVRLINGRKTLDIGVYTGYSALTVALVLPEGGKVVACDLSEEFTSVGKPFWKEAGVDQKVDLRIGPAADTLQSLLDNGEAGTYDYAYIDADKSNYMNYYEKSLQLVRSGGIIAVDNVLWGGKVYDEKVNDADTLAIRELNDHIHKDQRVHASLLPIGDGVNVVFKK